MSDQEKQVASGSKVPPSEQHERDEKEEKERHEHEEKQEKEQPRDALSSVMWALFLIAAGVILLAQSQGWVTWDQFGGLWNLFFVGIGLLMLVEAVLRLILPAYRRPILGQVIAGAILLAIGFSGMTGFQMTGPVILIGIGIAILLGGLFRGRV